MNEAKIKKIIGQQIFDSRGIPTVCAEVMLESGIKASACVPSGASTGKYEAVELRDNAESYNGKGVSKAVNNINTEINEILQGANIFQQAKIDDEMIKLDGTENKGKLGANAILAVSLACAKAGAQSLNIDLYKYLGGINSNVLPIPMMNILNGGAHADNNVEIQEFMIFPAGATSFREAMQMGTEIYSELKTILKSKNLSTGVGDEGGFAPNLDKDEQALELLVSAIEKAGYRAGVDVFICLDVAAGEWIDGNGGYKFPKKNKNIKAEELFSYYKNLTNKYPIVSIEDPFSDDDFENFSKFTKECNSKLQIVGDDLFVTNTKRLKKGLSMGSGNAILIKPNQIGTLTETLNAIKLAQEGGYSTIVSHRSGETEDTSIADIAVATNSGQIKTGAPCRSERVCKYNRLLQIENQLGGFSQYGIPHSANSSIILAE
jgi:phosphopyruvate hydratase